MAKALQISGLVALCLLAACEATVYVVGDTAGWDISTDLASWPGGKIFKLGDVLLFLYSQIHTINQVEKNGYDNCNATNALLSRSDGNTSVPLTTTGENYFICGTLSHCLGGMKLHIHVTNNPTPPPAATKLPPEMAPTSPLTQTPGSSNNNELPTLVNGLAFGRTSDHLFMAFCWSIAGFFWLRM
ncbi:hypothetical protein HPP92_025396 [Vanilla planifolia]|uniref:Phytocyanin domain-containing protein n=1 Tax=Vanilla planifolia TaxID=51239 RepID=A0A835PPZ9_VANPL|nr:hypothetical protein HPP92_025396 [Vanilla planifolia]